MNSQKFRQIVQALGLLVLSLAFVIVPTESQDHVFAQPECTGEITTRVLKLLQDNTDGTVGLYLKEVGGPVLANCNERFVFEPASTIKVLHHLHAMLAVQNKSIIGGSVVTLETWIRWYTDYNTAISYSCPGDKMPALSPLKDLLLGMMRVSDNRHTQALRVYFGEENINATAQQLVGMKDTALRHRIGCGGGRDGAIAKPNRLTLYDAGLLYEKVADGSLLTPEYRQIFYEIMLGKDRDITRIVDEEAPSPMTPQQKTAFLNQMDMRQKSGSYDLCNPVCLQYRSIAGWAKIPFCREGVVTPREYVFGIFIHGAIAAVQAFNVARVELLREQIRAALQAFPACSG